MKTLGMALCGFALVGTASVAQAGFREAVGVRAAGYHDYRYSTASCADGTCLHDHHTGFHQVGYGTTGNCANGTCGHYGCADGSCGIDARTSRYGLGNRSYAPRTTVPRPVTPYSPAARTYYTGYGSTSACPGGICPTQPRPAVTRQPVYPTVQPYQAQRYNPFGLRF